MTTPTNPPADETTTPSEDNVPSPAPALTLADLDVIEARAAAATEGPWSVTHRAKSMADVEAPHSCECESGEHTSPLESCGTAGISVAAGDMRAGACADHDAAFIAKARTDVPALVAALRQAWATNASLRVGWKVDMRKAREARAELDHIRSELDVQRYHAEHDPCDVCSHLEAVELGELIDRLAADVQERTAERDRARSVAVALECEVERLRAGIEALAGVAVDAQASVCCYGTRDGDGRHCDCKYLSVGRPNFNRGDEQTGCCEFRLIAWDLRALLAPPDAQEPAQEPRTGAGGPGVPTEGCEAASAFYERLPGRHVHHYGQGTHDLGGTECECGPTVVEVPTQDGAQ